MCHHLAARARRLRSVVAELAEHRPELAGRDAERSDDVVLGRLAIRWRPRDWRGHARLLLGERHDGAVGLLHIALRLLQAVPGCLLARGVTVGALT
eukprot:1050131-Pyramimonas_sp.AAC.1